MIYTPPSWSMMLCQCKTYEVQAPVTIKTRLAWYATHVHLLLSPVPGSLVLGPRVRSVRERAKPDRHGRRRSPVEHRRPCGSRRSRMGFRRWQGVARGASTSRNLSVLWDCRTDRSPRLEFRTIFRMMNFLRFRAADRRPKPGVQQSWTATRGGSMFLILWVSFSTGVMRISSWP